jgi:hypothetical protein
MSDWFHNLPFAYRPAERTLLHGDVLIEEVEPYIRPSIAADEERARQRRRQQRRKTPELVFGAGDAPSILILETSLRLLLQGLRDSGCGFRMKFTNPDRRGADRDSVEYQL